MRLHMVSVAIEITDDRIVIAQDNADGSQRAEITVPLEQVGYLADLLQRVERLRRPQTTTTGESDLRDSSIPGSVMRLAEGRKKTKPLYPEEQKVDM